jgi:hypothetical protein
MNMDLVGAESSQLLPYPPATKADWEKESSHAHQDFSVLFLAATAGRRTPSSWPRGHPKRSVATKLLKKVALLLLPLSSNQRSPSRNNNSRTKPWI